MHSLGNIEFPVTFTEEECLNLGDQKIIYALQIIHYLRKQLHNVYLNIETIKETELRMQIRDINNTQQYYPYDAYRMKLTPPKPVDEISFLTGQGGSVCKGLNNFVEYIKKKYNDELE